MNEWPLTSLVFFILSDCSVKTRWINKYWPSGTLAVWWWTPSDLWGDSDCCPEFPCCLWCCGYCGQLNALPSGRPNVASVKQQKEKCWNYVGFMYDYVMALYWIDFLCVSTGLTSLSLAKTENLVELVWKQRKCWPEAWAVKVNLPNFPYRLEITTYKGKTSSGSSYGEGLVCVFSYIRVDFVHFGTMLV